MTRQSCSNSWEGRGEEDRAARRAGGMGACTDDATEKRSGATTE